MGSEGGGGKEGGRGGGLGEGRESGLMSAFSLSRSYHRLEWYKLDLVVHAGVGVVS